MKMPQHTGGRTVISRHAERGLFTARLECGDVVELFVTAVPLPGEPASAMLRRAMSAAQSGGATICRQEVFCTAPAPDQPSGGSPLSDADWPVTWLRVDPGQQELTGTHVQAVAGAPVRRIHSARSVVGSVYQSAHARYCHLGGIVPPDTSCPRREQAAAIFHGMSAALEQARMSFTNVVRTWLFLDDILAWYGQFNNVRDAFFRQFNVVDGVVPASTGVGGRNVFGAAAVAGALAVEPLGDGVKCLAVPSPLQCPAREYGSAFSRAVEVQAPDHRRLYVSGTASIEPGGRTAHVGDLGMQIDLTLRVVHAILASRGMDWRDVVRATVYVQRAEFAQAWATAAGNLPPMPTVVAEHTICREDLLFEIEVDAIASGGTAETALSHPQERVQ
jgi:enamine deaminase RidA (YjgF/YER057c/UK114 family)